MSTLTWIDNRERASGGERLKRRRVSLEEKQETFCSKGEERGQELFAL